ncbi:fluoride efflux transporter CrcB [Pistricoccus aurantiacus]|uniref:Fluoride-specific ion channel FluC n=1 Tax=Pistricoccus aurantiacus TaxID=1883414 RepID=A0A5B8SV88_9GAMM|nr:fluoride efflux transporter CrcB [Pistricoccus aurantiacus]QEA40114.1 fluoride efflux transporter CrcB [Pistricoccus aurantiacus]
MGLSMIAIGAGAAIGANLRWLLGLWLNQYFPGVPLGTLLANWLGAWLIGLGLAFFSAQPQLSQEWRFFAITGLLGALTTFSTFSAEMFADIQAGRWLVALAGIGLHVAGSILLVALGIFSFQLFK